MYAMLTRSMVFSKPAQGRPIFMSQNRGYSHIIPGLLVVGFAILTYVGVQIWQSVEFGRKYQQDEARAEARMQYVQDSLASSDSAMARGNPAARAKLEQLRSADTMGPDRPETFQKRVVRQATPSELARAKDNAMR